MTKGKKALCIEINLLPAEFRQSKADFSWIVDRRVIWPTVALFVFLVSAFMLQTTVTDTIDELDRQLKSTQEEVEKEKPLLKKISALDETMKVIGQKINALKSIQVSKKRWVILFENISSMMPPNMWLTSLNQVGPYDMELRGTTYDFSEV
ncbi:MAG: fimbrial assembly protein, partial [Fibrobacteraceae bacterium]